MYSQAGAPHPVSLTYVIPYLYFSLSPSHLTFCSLLSLDSPVMKKHWKSRLLRLFWTAQPQLWQCRKPVKVQWWIPTLPCIHNVTSQTIRKGNQRNNLNVHSSPVLHHAIFLHEAISSEEWMLHMGAFPSSSWRAPRLPSTTVAA